MIIRQQTSQTSLLSTDNHMNTSTQLSIQYDTKLIYILQLLVTANIKIFYSTHHSYNLGQLHVQQMNLIHI